MSKNPTSNLKSSMLEEPPGPLNEDGKANPSRTIKIPVDWVPRCYQIPLIEYMEAGGKRAAVVWHRRAGKDLFAINYIAKSMMERPGVYWHVFPTYSQGRKVVWDGFTKSGKRFTEAFPPELVKSKNDQQLRIELHNGSIYQVVGADDPDNLVGANPFGIVFSEWSLIHPRAWTLLRPILRENGGWAIFIYTPRGKNHGWTLYSMAQKLAAQGKRWFHQKLSVADTEKMTREYAETLEHEKDRAYALSQIPMDSEAIAEEREEGMSDEMIQQEYFVDFNAPLVGAYYGDYMNRAEDQGRIQKRIPYDPLLPVDTAWDIGIDDQTSIWFTQQHAKEIRVIDYVAKSGEGLPFYVDIVKKRLRGFVEGYHYFPHDVAAREWGTGKTRIEQLKALGITPRLVKRQDVADGIEAVRAILPRCYFSLETCEEGIQALREYSKDYDEKARTFLARPLHNWASHGADAFRTFAMGFRDKSRKGTEKERDKRQPDSADGGFNVL